MNIFIGTPIEMRFSIFIVLCIFCIHVPHANANSQTSAQSPTKIICIGDSITQGGNVEDEYTYRLPLYRLLKKKGFNVSFTGVRTEGVNLSFHWPADFDSHHEGFYGAKTEYVRRALIDDLPKLPTPDIAIVDLGSNDQGTDVEQAVVEPLSNIVAQLRAQNPNVQIIIIQIPGMLKNFRLHYLIWRMAHKLSQPKSSVTTIPLYFGWNTKGDTFDGAHPNIQGQNKMATAIFSELEHIITTK